jgi:sugar transferase (PEP-CTERM/EpsH1 system associated)
LKILWIKADKILPVHSGGNIRSYHILRHLARDNELTFFSYYDGQPDPHYEQELKQQFPEAVCLWSGKPRVSGIKRGLDYISRLPLAAPYAVSRFASSRVQQRLNICIRERDFDIVVCDFLDAAINLPARLPMPTLLFQHNVETEIWRRHAATASTWPSKLVYRLEFAKMLAYERSMVRKFQRVIAVSEHDRQLMSAWGDPSRITVVPTGVDLQQYQPDWSADASEPLVLFVGAMDWEPNVDAVEYFSREIWPSVLNKVPGARFRIVGRNPGNRVRKLESPSIQVTGSVTSVADYLRAAAVVVVPLRIGGGTRLKIYEAMAMGKAVVSTSVGAEGLDVHNGRDVVLADVTDRFADAVSKFLHDRALRNAFEHAAAALASQYDWSNIAGRFLRVLEQTANVPPSTPECAPLMLERN